MNRTRKSGSKRMLRRIVVERWMKKRTAGEARRPFANRRLPRGSAPIGRRGAAALLGAVATVLAPAALAVFAGASGVTVAVLRAVRRALVAHRAAALVRAAGARLLRRRDLAHAFDDASDRRRVGACRRAIRSVLLG